MQISSDRVTWRYKEKSASVSKSYSASAKTDVKAIDVGAKNQVLVHIHLLLIRTKLDR